MRSVEPHRAPLRKREEAESLRLQPRSSVFAIESGCWRRDSASSPAPRTCVTQSRKKEKPNGPGLSTGPVRVDPRPWGLPKLGLLLLARQQQRHALVDLVADHVVLHHDRG